MKHSYSDRFTAVPAMVVDVEMYAPGTARSVRVPAKIDAGADLCVIPHQIVTDIRLVTFGHRWLHAVGHSPYDAPTYRADFMVDMRKFHMEVVSHQRPYALLGTDLINEWILIADGPAGIFELVWPGSRTSRRRGAAN